MVKLFLGEVIDGEMLTPNMAAKDIVAPPKATAAAGITLELILLVFIGTFFCSIHLVGDKLLHGPWEGSELLMLCGLWMY